MLLIQLERYTAEFPMPTALQNLREIAIYWEESSECNLHQYSRIFALAQIETVYFTVLCNWRTLDDDSASFISNGKSTVKYFIVDTWEREPTSLVALLKLPSGLEQFTLNYCFDDNSFVYFSQLLQGLVRQHHSLKRTDIGSRLRIMHAFGLGRLPAFWNQFSVLKELRILISFLLYEGISYAHNRLKDLLPKSLTSLTLYAVNLLEVSVWVRQLEESLITKNGSTQI
jgi:hypothetical protein